ncbi:unnamed protein product [Diabrotica balteata]|uniref:non-specific serine/threonine protein kinase n=1 Tax=Diabrotica balteata TaxID=107213 RepID=A0A9N9X7U0_DIABA|nr:unnamed protein product [Diabrotica balteata]
MSSNESEIEPFPVDLDVNYNPALHETYHQQIYTSPIKVGEGSFGIVCKAVNKFNNKKYAIKEFRRTLTSDFKYTEIQNNEKVGIHPNCVKFYMAWEECGEVYMKMEACQMSLMDYSKKNIIQEPLVWDCLYDMCKALKYLHEKLLVHRDVKASNIMLYGTYFKLTDFGTIIDLNEQPESTTSIKMKLSKDDVRSRNFQSKVKPARDILELGLTFSRLMTGVRWSSPSTTEVAPDVSESQESELKK